MHENAQLFPFKSWLYIKLNILYYFILCRVPLVHFYARCVCILMFIFQVAINLLNQHSNKCELNWIFYNHRYHYHRMCTSCIMGLNGNKTGELERIWNGPIDIIHRRLRCLTRNTALNACQDSLCFGWGWNQALLAYLTTLHRLGHLSGSNVFSRCPKACLVFILYYLLSTNSRLLWMLFHLHTANVHVYKFFPLATTQQAHTETS